jgi:hypothetical protein
MRVMRLVWVLGSILCAPVFAQELDINGYSKVVVPRSQGLWFNENAVLREVLRTAGFEVYRSVNDIPREAWSTALYMRAGAGGDFGEVLYIAVFDVASDSRIAACAQNPSQVRAGHVPGRSSGSADAFGRMAINQLIEGLGYRSFAESAHEANLRAFAGATITTQQSTTPTADASPNTPRLSCGVVPPTAETEERPTRRSRRRSQD